MKSYRYIFFSLSLVGCMASNSLQYDAVSEANAYHMAKIRKGMSEKQVLQVMRRPYSYETFQAGEDIYDVWFYVTRTTGLDQTRMVPQNLTPLTFKNGVLVGTGYQWYYYAMKEQREELATPPDLQFEDTPKPGAEDLEFEKTLKSFPEKTTPPQPSLNAPAAPQPDQNVPQSPAQMSMSPPIAQESSPPEIETFLEAETSSLKESAEISASAPPSYLKAWKPAPPLAIKQKTLSKAHKGMSRAEVASLLGSPSLYETFQMNGDVYDVWFYEITPSKKDPSLQKVPLTFKNAVLVGTTVDYYNGIKEAAGKEQIDCYGKEAERLQQDESEQNFNYW